MTTLIDIQKRAEVLSQTRDKLAGLFHTLQTNVNVMTEGSMPDIRRVARQIAKQHTELQELIKANPGMFSKPRTQVVEGLKFGLQKQPGKLSWASDQKLIQRIRALQAEGAITSEVTELLINTTEKPVAKALEKLDGKLLKRLGVELGSDTDEPLIKSVDSAVEKAVNAVIKDITSDANAEVQA